MRKRSSIIPRGRLNRIVILSIAILGLAGFIAVAVMDPEQREIARYRNALIAEPGVEADFNWSPNNVPPNYLQETVGVPAELPAWSTLAPTGDTLARALTIARTLSQKPRVGGRIQRSIVETLATIQANGTGYCVDYAMVFSALAHINGIKGRLWAFSFDGFGGHGHVFNEVWDQEKRTWLMIDVFHGFYPQDAQSHQPLSALEFRRRVLSYPDSIRWERITPVSFSFKDETEALSYYRKGSAQWFLWWGNNFLTRERQPLVSSAARFGRLPEQVAAIATGNMPRLKMLVTPDNRNAFERLMRLKNMLIVAAVVELVLFMLLIWNLLLFRYQRPPVLGKPYLRGAVELEQTPKRS